MKKRVLSTLLALCLAFSLFGTALAAAAAETTAAPGSASSAEGQTDPAVTDDTSGETAAPEGTETPAETPEETETQAVTETPGETETSDGAEQPSNAAVSMPAQSFEQTLDNGITVAVEAPEGALPQGVTLNAAMLDTDSEDARQAAAQLDEAGVSYDGFVALDVSFTDASGAELEPALPVTVRFELPEGLLPEDVDTDSLAVQHLAEDDTGAVVSVETVADAAEEAEGTISVNDTEASAAFVVEGFSTFTLTWMEDHVIWDKTESLEFRIVDTDGNELTLPGSYDLSYALPESGKVTFETIVEENRIKTITVGGVEYVFQNATLVSDQLRYPINAAERIDGTLDDEVRLYDSVMPNSTGFYTRDDGGAGGESDEHLELVYRRADESNSEVYEPEPEYSKTATTNDGGQTYDLTLSVSGDVGSSMEKQKVDVLFIVDQSGSMDERDMEQGKTRQQVVAEQAKDLAEALAANENLDAQFAVVTFSDSLGSTQYYNDAAIRLSWTDDTSAVYSAANQKSTGGTNYEAGMMTGRAALIESRPDALKYVIFLSDGEPTYYYDEKGNTDGNGSEFSNTYLTSAIKQAEFYSAVNGFFTIRVGDESNADARLTKLYAAVRDEVGASGDSENFGNYRAKDSGELAQKFAEIAAQITSLSMSNVSICDTLSEWVEPVSGAEPYVIVRDAGGNVTTAEDNFFEVTYDNKELRLEFAEEYELKDGYVYELHLQIQPSDEAYSAGSGSYTEIGDPDTGTYAGESGFPSNKTATLTYDTDLMKDHSLTYDMPVVQVRTATLTLQKTFVGLTDEDVYYILFGQAERPNDSAGNEAWNSYYQANFSFDVNFCDSNLDNKTDGGQPYMAEDSSIPDSIMKPGDSSRVTNGGDFIVYAAKCLNYPENAANLSNATNEANRATLEKEDGNWVYTQVIDVAVCTSENLFYTVFEQHGELPGYAKLDPDSAVYSVYLNGTNSWTGHGKFVQDADVESPAINLPDEDEINGIRDNVLARLSITDDTTISFTNYYTDAMTLTKTVTLDGETATEALLDEIGTTEYVITLRPADTTKLVNSHDLGPGWSTKMNGYEVGVSYSNSLTGGQTHDNKTLTFNEDGTLTVKLYAGESVTINDLPAINWSVVETTPSDTTDYYWTGVTYAEDYNDAKVDNGPRDDQYDADSENSWANDEKAAEKDNEGADHWNRYEPGDTYGMTDYTDGTVVLDVDVALSETDNGPSVAVTLTNDYAHYYTLIIEKQVTGGMGDTSEFFDFFTSVSRGEDVVAVNSGSATNNNLGLGFVLTTQGTNARYNSDDIVDNYGFQLADNGTLTITKLKADDVVTLAETDANANGYETTYAGAEAVSDESGNYTVAVGSEDAVTVEGDSTTLKVTVTNHRDPATPTDADTNSTAPYLVLTACAAFAGLALAGSIVTVRLRRRRQE